jgi:hypothetical protein
MIIRLRESKLFVLFLFVLFVFQIYAVRNYFNDGSDPVIKFANNNFHVDTVTGNVSAPNGTTMDLVFITKVRPIAGVQKFEYKYTTFRFCGNMLTGIDAESEWIEVDVSQ